MPRPLSPLIEREAVAELALKIIDAEGLAALSTRRLGRELGVSNAALYHHFANKDEIVVCAAELALRRTPVPRAPSSPGGPEDLLVEGAHMLLDMLSAHPALLPVLVERRRLGMGEELLDRVKARLVDQGLDRETIVDCLDMLERFVIGIIYRSVTTASRRGKPKLDAIDRDAFDRAARGIVKALVA